MNAVPTFCKEYELNPQAVSLVIKAERMSEATSGPNWDSEDAEAQRNRKEWLAPLEPMLIGRPANHRQSSIGIRDLECKRTGMAFTRAPPACLIRGNDRLQTLKRWNSAENIEDWGEWDDPEIKALMKIAKAIMEEDANEQRREDEAAAEAAAQAAKEKKKKKRKERRQERQAGE
ncbi:hypothetical protein FRB90_005060 [Tulasnella sp. 427]|nr:hypothetical protein FRB90_005060 [Tulasnella sp. 427]